MMKPVKLLVIAHDAGSGGAQRSLLELLERLAPADYRPLVLVPTPGPFVQAVRGLGLKCLWGVSQRWVFFRKPMAGPVLLRRPWRLFAHPYLQALFSLLTLPIRMVLLVALARKEGIGLVYSNTITVLDGALLARLLGVPHVWHLRETVAGNPDLDFPLPLAWLPGFVLGWSDRVIVNSHALRCRLFGTQGDDKVRVIWNGVDLCAAEEGRPLYLPGIPTGAPLTAVCGRLHERKGIPVYLAAVARLQRDHPDAHHLVIGDGQPEYVRLLRAEAARLGLGGHVHFLGHRSDVRELLAGVDVVVSAASLEPFGRTLVEAMAQGVAVVATRSGGPEEIIEDGKSGYLVDVGDAEALADRMARLLDDRMHARAIGMAGRQRVQSHFSLDVAVARITGVFSEVLPQHPG
jgi:glycosyltransferase involved in cell wall biosynthesis